MATESTADLAAREDAGAASPLDRCVHELIADQVARTPHATAVEFEGRSLSYADLWERASRLARRLQRLGVGPDVLVGVAVERSPEMLVAVLGVLAAGGAYIPLDPAYPRDRIAFMLEDAGADVLVTEEPLLDRLPDHGGRTVLVDRDWPSIAEEQPLAPECAAGPRNLAYVIYTSGSTGRPKGVMVEHRSVCNLLDDMRRRPGLEAGDRLLAVTTLSFDIAGVELYLPLIVGGTVVLVSRGTAGDGRFLRDALDCSGADAMQATPASWRMLIEAGWPGGEGLKALCGGEALPVALAKQLLERCGEVWNVYGPTEATIWSTFRRVQEPDDALSIGRPFQNTDLWVLDEALAPVPAGTPGELHIGGAGLARGYLGRQDLTSERFIAHPFSSDPEARLYKTGDLVRERADGSIEFLGRLDSQIKLNGFRVELGEVETALEECDGVMAAAAVARERDGEKRLLGYVRTNGGPPVSGADLRRRLGERLPAYMVPSAVVALDEFPLTPNGKVDRGALPDPESLTGPERTVVPPSDPVEERLVEIWEHVLGISPIGIEDDFFDLGIGSLTAARLFAEVEKEFDSRLPLAPVFEAPTIAALARLIREGGTGSSRLSSLVPLRSAGTRPPLFCVHGGAGTILFYHDLTRRLGEDQPVYGLQARGVYGRDAPLLTTEEMAAHYIGELRQVQPRGPYRLVGYCFGGLVAYEMAQRLRADGDDVELLTLINAPSSDYIRRYNPFFREENDHAPVAPRRVGPRWFDGIYWKLRRKSQTARYKAYRATGRPVPERFRNGLFLLVAHYAERNYRARPYDGPVLLLHGSGLYAESDLGWRGLVGDRLESVEVPGAHTIPRHSMSEPNVAFVADRLEQALP